MERGKDRGGGGYIDVEDEHIPSTIAAWDTEVSLRALNAKMKQGTNVSGRKEGNREHARPREGRDRGDTKAGGVYWGRSKSQAWPD